MTIITITTAILMSATPEPAQSMHAPTHCNWDRPGADPYRGPVKESVSAALARYPDIPPAAAAEIVGKAQRLDLDTTVRITRDGIHSKGGDVANLRDMHHGKNKVCMGPVRRNAWSDSHAEIAMVYCSGIYCVAIPIVCGNVSRVDFFPAAPKPPVVVQPGPVGPQGPAGPIGHPGAPGADFLLYPKPHGHGPSTPGGSTGVPWPWLHGSGWWNSPPVPKPHSPASAPHGGGPRPSPHNTIPEPGTAALLAAGLAIMAVIKRIK